MNIGEKILQLTDGRPNTLYMTYNEHWTYPEPIQEWADNRDGNGKEYYVNEDEYQKSIETDSIWEVQWYPFTRVGCIILRASGSMEGLNMILDRLLEQKQRNDSEFPTT